MPPTNSNQGKKIDTEIGIRRTGGTDGSTPLLKDVPHSITKIDAITTFKDSPCTPTLGVWDTLSCLSFTCRARAVSVTERRTSFLLLLLHSSRACGEMLTCIKATNTLPQAPAPTPTIRSGSPSAFPIIRRSTSSRCSKPALPAWTPFVTAPLTALDIMLKLLEKAM